MLRLMIRRRYRPVKLGFYMKPAFLLKRAPNRPVEPGSCRNRGDRAVEDGAHDGIPALVALAGGRWCSPADHQMRHAPSSETMHGPIGEAGRQAVP